MHGWQPASSRPPVCSLCVFTAPCVCDHGPRVGVTAPCMCMFTAPCVGVCVCSLPPVCVHCPLCVCAFTAPCVCVHCPLCVFTAPYVCVFTAPCVCVHCPLCVCVHCPLCVCVHCPLCVCVHCPLCVYSHPLCFLLSFLVWGSGWFERTHLGRPECVLIFISMDSLSWCYQ